MRVRRLAALLGAAICCAGGAARADGFYVAAFGGPFKLNDADNQGSGLDAEDKTETGLALSGAVGYAWPGGFRLEGEVAYRRNSFDEATVRSDGGLGAALGVGTLNGATLDVGGDVTTLSAMANVYYDLRTGTPFTPYVGAGLGAARLDAELDLGALRLVDDKDDVLAYQLMAGVSYQASPNWRLAVGYRYFATQDAELRDTVLGLGFDSEYSGHGIEIGVRWSF